MTWLDDIDFKRRLAWRQIDISGCRIPREPHMVQAEKERFLTNPMPALIGTSTDENSRSYRGGLPLLPSSLPWPTERGIPLVFEGQVNLSDVPKSKSLPWLPVGGTLFYFVGTKDIDDFDHPTLRIIHSNDAADQERDRPAATLPLLKRTNIKFVIQNTYNNNFDGYQLQFDDQNEFDDWQRRINPATNIETLWQIGGWPKELSAHPEIPQNLERKLRGLAWDDYSIITEPDFVQATSKWRYLGAVNRLGLTWAPYHDASVWVREDHALRGDFSCAALFPTCS